MPSEHHELRPYLSAPIHRREIPRESHVGEESRDEIAEFALVSEFDWCTTSI